MSLNEIKDMPLRERLQMMEVLLDSFRYDDEESFASPQWHQDVLKARLDAIEKGDTRSFDLEEIKVRRR